MVTLATMPDEAFGWFVVWAARSTPSMPAAFKYPDGIGGFREASRVSITRLRDAAEQYIQDSNE